MHAALSLLHEELAPWAPLPPLVLGDLHQHKVLSPPLIGSQHLELLAAQPRMPPHLALRAEQPLAARALRLPHRLLPIVNHKRRAILERAVEPLRREDHGLAERRLPPREHVRGDDILAQLRPQDPLALDLRTLHHQYVLLDLRADVPAQAVAAEGVGAVAAPEHLGCRCCVHADLAEHWGARRGLAPLINGYHRRRSDTNGTRSNHRRHEHFLELELVGVLLVGDGEELLVCVGERREVEVIHQMP